MGLSYCCAKCWQWWLKLLSKRTREREGETFYDVRQWTVVNDLLLQHTQQERRGTRTHTHTQTHAYAHTNWIKLDSLSLCKQNFNVFLLLKSFTQTQLASTLDSACLLRMPHTDKGRRLQAAMSKRVGGEGNQGERHDVDMSDINFINCLS